MTTVATRPKFSVMHIIRTVTVDACSWRRFDLFHRNAMAAVAVNILMLAGQLELCLGIVIKPPYLPAVRGMAKFTILPKLALMGIVFLMARITRHWGILVRR